MSEISSKDTEVEDKRQGKLIRIRKFQYENKC